MGDIRDADAVDDAVAQAVERFGGIDIVVNNASAINLAPMRDLEVKRFDLMQTINARGTFVVTRACLPHLRQSEHAHVLTLSPAAVDRPALARRPQRLHALEDGHDDASRSGSRPTRPRPGSARTACGRARSSPPPPSRTCSAATRRWRAARTPEIVADAAHAILVRDPRATSGNTFIDDEVLAEAGVTDLSGYAAADADLTLDIFVDSWPEERV